MPERPGEFELIRALLAGRLQGEGVIVGPGDDAAVLRPREGLDLVVTTDTFVEGRHFRRDLLSPEQVGSRLAAANLSDLAAMAAVPRWGLIALAVPAAWDAAHVVALERACAQALEAQGVAMVGGNLTATDGPLDATVTLIGDVAQDAHWTRAGARPGDVLAVTGHPGRAAAMLALALWGNPPSLERVPAALRESFVVPPCRVKTALALAALSTVAGGRSVHACIDVSDGLVGDLAHLCRASGVGATITAWPDDPELWRAAREISTLVSGERAAVLPASAAGILEHLRLSPGDDYELLLAIDPARFDECMAAAAGEGTALFAIGEITAATGSRLRRADGTEQSLPDRGYDHFAS